MAGRRPRRRATRSAILEIVGDALRATDPLTASARLREVEVVLASDDEPTCHFCGRGGAVKLIGPRVCGRCAGIARVWRLEARDGRSRPGAREVIEAVRTAFEASHPHEAPEILERLSAGFAITPELPGRCISCGEAADAAAVHGPRATLCSNCISRYAAMRSPGEADDRDPLSRPPETSWERLRSLAEAVRRAHPDRAAPLLAEIAQHVWALGRSRAESPAPPRSECALCRASDLDARGLLSHARHDLWGDYPYLSTGWVHPDVDRTLIYDPVFALCTVCVDLASNAVVAGAARRKRRAPRPPADAMILADATRAVRALVPDPETTVAFLERAMAAGIPLTPIDARCTICRRSDETGKGLVWAGEFSSICGRCLSQARDALASPPPRRAR